MAGAKGRSGGSRPGAGPKPKRERFARPIAAAEKKIADRLPELVENQFTLALGGGERVEERYEAAGSVLVDGILRDGEGKPIFGDRGQSIRTKVPAFPDLEPTELVLVERKVVTLGPDRAANEYLIDRILGKPTQAVELTGEDGGPISTAPTLDLSRLSDEELADLERFVVKATHGEGDPSGEGTPEPG